MRCLVLILALLVSACRLETEAEARAEAARWLHAGEQLAFATRFDCVVAAYRLTRPELRGDLAVTPSAARALELIRQGRAVALRDPAMTPQDLSRALSSLDLPRGLGLITSVTVPQDCMTDAVARGTMALMMSPGAALIFEHGGYRVAIADFERMVAVYMRARY